jgi:hypothetical protein
MPTVAEFNKMFSMPREPETVLGPGQSSDLAVPTGKKALITDVYVENLGGGRSNLRILEQRGPNQFEVRYTFRTAEDQVTVVNFATGLKLGDEGSIAGNIRIENAPGSQANVLPRVNGVFVP